MEMPGRAPATVETEPDCQNPKGICRRMPGYCPGEKVQSVLRSTGRSFGHIGKEIPLWDVIDSVCPSRMDSCDLGDG